MRSVGHLVKQHSGGYAGLLFPIDLIKDDDVRVGRGIYLCFASSSATLSSRSLLMPVSTPLTWKPFPALSPSVSLWHFLQPQAHMVLHKNVMKCSAAAARLVEDVKMLLM
jgi:hypothetical protein